MPTAPAEAGGLASATTASAELLQEQATADGAAAQPAPGAATLAEPGTASALAAGGTAAAPQQQQQRRRRQSQQSALGPPAQPAAVAQLPPSRPLAEFLSSLAASAAAAAADGSPAAPRPRGGEEALRVLCQVMAFVRAAHARGAVLGRLRPAGLRVTASCIVLLDPSAMIPAAEEELYAAPEELFAPAARPIDGAAAAPAPAAATRRTPAGDMFSLGLLLLQLLHPAPPVSGGAVGDGQSSGAAVARMLRDARHQILPSALLQVRAVTEQQS